MFKLECISNKFVDLWSEISIKTSEYCNLLFSINKVDDKWRQAEKKHKHHLQQKVWTLLLLLLPLLLLLMQWCCIYMLPAAYKNSNPLLQEMS